MHSVKTKFFSSQNDTNKQNYFLNIEEWGKLSNFEIVHKTQFIVMVCNV